MNALKKIIVLILFLSIIILFSTLTTGCQDNNITTPPINTTEYFKYSLDRSNTYKEPILFRKFARYKQNVSTPCVDLFKFYISTSESGFERLSGAFTFLIFNDFLVTATQYSWGAPGVRVNSATATSFIFTDLTNTDLLAMTYTCVIACTSTNCPTNIRGFNYTDIYINTLQTC